MLNFLKSLLFEYRSVKNNDEETKLIDQLRLIRPELGLRIYSPDYNNLVFRTPYQCITDYNRFLIRIRLALEKPENFKSSLLSNGPEFIYFTDWFIQSNGTYVNANNELTTFQSQSINLIETFIELKKKEKTEHNQRVLNMVSPLLNQIQEITNTILEVLEGKDKIDVSKIVRKDGY